MPLSKSQVAVAVAVAMIGMVCWSSPSTAAQPAPKVRRLSPGVLTTIRPEHEVGESFAGPLPLVELVKLLESQAGLATPPNFAPESATLLDQAKAATLRRQIWHLEFTFKPLRRIAVDVPQPNGKMERKLIWYLVYKVKNIGKDWKPTAKDLNLDREPVEEFQPKIVDVESFDSARLIFLPTFIFRGQVLVDGKYEAREYLDRILPVAVGPIAEREGIVGQTLHNSVEICRVPIELSSEKVDRSVWGVVTWEDIDPRIDYFSLFIKGLTNAYKFRDAPDKVAANSPPTTARRFAYKTLQLNFWRAGDSVLESEDEIHYGVRTEPDEDKQTEILQRYGLKTPLDHLWIYR